MGKTDTTIAMLNMGADLALPENAVTQAIAILAERRAGKSNTGVRLAEQMYCLRLPWVAVDPKGDWWGMRSNKGGAGPGLPVPVLGGLHGDMPLTPESGRLVAELIVEQNITCILDVSDFPSDAARTRFLLDFARHLFDLHRKHPQPRHLFLEEADDYIPQQVTGDVAKCVGAWSKIVKQGGGFGLGVTLLSQRSAVVNKNVLTQVGTLIALRTTSPQDRAAVKAWIDYHAGSREVIDSLPKLADGEGWVISPHWLALQGQPAIQRVQFWQRTTFDSGATPTMASAARPPATLADIDLSALATRMKEVAEQAAADDPAVLRARIRQLERQLTAKDTAETGMLREQVTRLTAELAGLRSQPPETIPVFDPGDISRLEEAVSILRNTAGNLEGTLARARTGAAQPASRTPASTAAPAVARRLPAPQPARARPAAATPAADSMPAIGKPHRLVLAVLAKFPDGRDKRSVAMLAGYSPNAGHFSNTIGALRKLLLIEPGMPLKITPAGIAVLGDDYEPLPEGPALIEFWMGQLGRAEREVLRVLLDAYPAALTKQQLGEMTGYSPGAGHFGNALGRLRTLQLIDGRGEMRADETLALEAAKAHA